MAAKSMSQSVGLLLKPSVAHDNVGCFICVTCGVSSATVFGEVHCVQRFLVHPF